MVNPPERPELYEHVRIAPGFPVRNEGNYLLGLNKSQWPGGDIRPGLEAGSLVGGHITPAVALVVGAQKIVLFNKVLFS